jgi:hypothetical protein
MVHLRALALTAAVGLSAPALAAAQPQWGPSTFDPAYNEGYERGYRAGADDLRRRDRYDFTDEGDYRNGERGYRSQYGSRDRYRSAFRQAFQDGYRAGYGNYAYGPGRTTLPPWSAGRGRGVGRYDSAYEIGFNDGYEAGINDARGRRRYDPISEGRYRSADRGYERYYGTREAYKIGYREAFKQGYNRGYQDARRYGSGTGWRNLFGFRF